MVFFLVTVAVHTVCVSECKNFFSDWTKKNAIGAHVSEGNGLKYITTKMQSILQQEKQCVFIDVGAASYGKENSQDYSDSLIFLKHTTTCTGFAFEIIPYEAVKLKKLSENYKDRIRIFNMGVSNTTGTMTLYHPEGAASHNTYTLKSDRKNSDPSIIKINTTSLDIFHENFMKSKHISYIKIDAEGFDPVIAHGMSHILTQKSVDIVSFEYSIGWDKLFETLTRNGKMHNDHVRGQKALHIIGNLKQSLRSFQSYMSSFGYETFIIVGKSSEIDFGTQNVTIVPIFGAMWDDWYELCLHTCQYKHCWHCWTDILVLNPEAVLARELKSELLLKGKEQCYDIKYMKNYC